MERQRRTMTPDGICPMCDLADETLFHRFRDCPSSRAVWDGFKIRKQGKFFNENNWHNWLKFNLNQKEESGEEPYWGTLFGVTLETLWFNRNDLVFRQIRNPAHGLRCKIRSQTEWIVSCILKKVIFQPQMLHVQDTVAEVWSPPPIGQWKLNSDGSVKDNGRFAGCGGILRGARGEFMFAYTYKLHACSVLEAELQGIYNGMKIAWIRGFRSLIVEVDSKEAVELLTRNVTGEDPIQQLVESIIELEDEDMNIDWRVVDRGINACADRLAKHSHAISVSSIIYDSVPGIIANLLCNRNSGPIGSDSMI